MNRIICAKWGSLYTNKDIDLLYEKVKRNCSVDFQFECFDNLDNSWDHYKFKHYRASVEPDHRTEIVENGFHRDDFGGIPHYRKLTLFNADKKFATRDKILYLDLDTNIESDIGYFFEEISNEKPYIVWNYWWEDNDGINWKRQYHITRCPLYNSSVLLWKPGQNKIIYDFISNHLDEAFFTYPSMDTFLFHQFGPHSYGKRKNHFNYFDRGVVTTQRELGDGKKGIINMLEGLSLKDKRKYVST